MLFAESQRLYVAEATIAKIDDNHYWYGCAAAAERHDWDHLVCHLPEDGSVTLKI